MGRRPSLREGAVKVLGWWIVGLTFAILAEGLSKAPDKKTVAILLCALAIIVSARAILAEILRGRGGSNG